MISGHSSQPPKSALKARKHVKSTQLPKLKPFVESEDEEDPIVQPILRGVLEVVLPQPTIVVRKPQSPWSPSSPKKQLFGPASQTAGSCPEVMKSPISRPEVLVSHLEAQATSSSCPEVEEESSNDTSSASDGDLPATTTFDITIPGPAKQPLPLLHQGKLALCDSIEQEVQPPLHVLHPLLHQEDQMCPCISGIPAQTDPREVYHRPDAFQDTRPCSIQCSISLPVQSHGRSKTITTKKTPAPAPAPAPAPVPAPVPAPAPAVRSSSVAVPRAALNVPMPDLHSMAIAIREGAAHIAILEARVQEQDTKIDTLQCLHESLRRTVVDRHPSFSLPDMLADGIMLLGQGGPMVEPTQVQPEGPQSSGDIDLPDEPGNLQPEFPGDIVVLNEPGNLLPEYDSSEEEMDVEGKVDLPGEEVDMAT
ncbi:hypothetical protein BDR06DRAFT_967420 [Suillus hirtellus]|nr:hypothetical protein BDR06DRAFT_967420 [Suillus hirtellus]